MRNMLIIVAVIAAIFTLAGVSSRSAPSLPFATVSSSVQKKRAHLYDVRTPEEFKAGHFAGATNWPLQDMLAGKLPDVPKDAKIYVYCRSGNRSGQATTLLKSAGYSNVTDLRGLSDVQNMGGKLLTH